MSLIDQRWLSGGVGVRRAGLPRLSGGADVGPRRAQRAALIQIWRDSAVQFGSCAECPRCSRLAGWFCVAACPWSLIVPLADRGGTPDRLSADPAIRGGHLATGGVGADSGRRDVEEGRDVAGHSSPRTALIYQHATRDKDETIAAAMGEVFTTARRKGTTKGRSGTQRARKRG